MQAVSQPQPMSTPCWYGSSERPHTRRTTAVAAISPGSKCCCCTVVICSCCRTAGCRSNQGDVAYPRATTVCTDVLTSGMMLLKCCCRHVALGMPTSALTATACLLSDDRVTWSKSTSRSFPTPERSSRCAAWLPTPCRQQRRKSCTCVIYVIDGSTNNLLLGLCMLKLSIMGMQHFCSQDGASCRRLQPAQLPCL
jgi:hypothetical protein